MARTGITSAWVSHLSAVYWRDPTSGNPLLYRALEQEAGLEPVPAVHPGLPNREAVLDEAVTRRVPGVRCDPTCYGLDPAGDAMRWLAAAAGERGLPLVLAVRLEDVRQRHPRDTTPELEPWAVRSLLRADRRARVLVTHADSDFVEQVHWGSTPEEAARVWWDISWIWGPPEDHLELLVESLGSDRFCFGTGQPLRLPEAPVARLDLTALDPVQRAAIEAGNARALRAS